MSRKGMPPPIDVVRFYAECNAGQWNAFLTACVAKQDVQKLTDVLHRLQQGMDNAVKQKLNTDALVDWFIRMQRSIENTIKEIHRMKNPNPLYQPGNDALKAQFIKDKRKHENELERFLMKARF